MTTLQGGKRLKAQTMEFNKDGSSWIFYSLRAYILYVHDIIIHSTFYTADK